MINPTKGPGRVAPIYHSMPHAAAANKTNRAQNADAQFDQVRISAAPDGQPFQALIAKIASEARIAHTKGDIQVARQEVESGNYRVDPKEIAARMLLEGNY